MATATLTTTTKAQKTAKTPKTSRQLVKAHPSLRVPSYDPAQTIREEAVYDTLGYCWDTLEYDTLPFYHELTGAQRRLVRAAIAAFGEAIIKAVQKAPSGY